MSMISPIIENKESFTVQIEKAKKQKRISSLLKGILFLLPSIVLFSVFVFYPLFKTMYLSFFLTDAKGATTVFVGLENYLYMFSDPIFLKSFKIRFCLCSIRYL